MNRRRLLHTIICIIIHQIIILSTTNYLFSQNKPQLDVEMALKAEKEDPEKAATILERALTFYSDNFDILFQLGRIYFEYSEEISNSRNKQLENAKLIGQNQTPDYFSQLAFTTLTQAQQIEPNHPDTKFLLSKISMKYKKYKEAIVYLDRYLELVPDYPEAFFIQGVAYLSLNDMENALKKFEQAATLNPGNGQNFYNMGIVLQKQEKYKKALENYIKAANIFDKQQKKKDLIDALANAGICAIKSGKPEDGVNYYNSAVNIDPKNPTGYINLAAFYVQKEYYDKALQVYNTYLNQVPDDGDIYNRILSLLNIAQKYQPGIAVMEALFKKDEKNLFAIYYLAECYRLSKDNDNAIKYFEKCISIAGKESQFTLYSIKKINEIKKSDSKDTTQSDNPDKK
jgi:tetratricopeptide (TPR) repeat protein